jgi:hypothetical protein
MMPTGCMDHLTDDLTRCSTKIYLLPKSISSVWLLSFGILQKIMKRKESSVYKAPPTGR